MGGSNLPAVINKSKSDSDFSSERENSLQGFYLT